jgi:S1-C subfamily serine protease
VVEVVDGSPAARAGIRPEDLIVELDGVPVEGADDLQRLMVGELISRSVLATIIRKGRPFSLELVPAELEY